MVTDLQKLPLAHFPKQISTKLQRLRWAAIFTLYFFRWGDFGEVIVNSEEVGYGGGRSIGPAHCKKLCKIIGIESVRTIHIEKPTVNQTVVFRLAEVL